jgi:hypothetical protein
MTFDDARRAAIDPEIPLSRWPEETNRLFQEYMGEVEAFRIACANFFDEAEIGRLHTESLKKAWKRSREGYEFPDDPRADEYIDRFKEQFPMPQLPALMEEI